MVLASRRGPRRGCRRCGEAGRGGEGAGFAVAVAELAERGYWGDFRKTGWKPYDLVACAILIRAHQHMPDAFVFNSDGVWEDESWLAARELIARVFGAEAAPTQDPMRYTGDGPPSTARRP